ncbi:MAG: GLPGLI family protein [Bacteroidaceae bacterium]|nr:GLPGLI family protein [Bacteroidaceae bacterium]
MNKKIITIIIALAAVCGGASAQQKQSTATRPRMVDYGVVKATVIGTSNIRILYAFNAKDLKDEDTWIDCGQLLTDKGMTQYASHFLAENDEALRQWLKANPHKTYYPNALKLKGFRKDIWSEYQYSQIFVRSKELTEWAVMPAAEFIQYRYTEPWPSMQWTLGSEKQRICGYQCQKATCHWRGRDYEAWFTSAIPMKSGPWKFGGLPGLIMKIYDTKHLYTWEAVSVENGSFPIYQLEERFFKDSDRKKVLKMQRDWNVKYNELSGRMYNGTMQVRTERYPYDQLELTEQ